MVDFLQNHTFTTQLVFMQVFWYVRFSIERPKLERRRLLQKFLQAFTIARPSVILDLPKCMEVDAQFLLNPETSLRVSELYRRYKESINQSEDSRNIRLSTDRSVNAGPLGPLIKAQLASAHHLLVDEAAQIDVDEDLADLVNENALLSIRETEQIQPHLEVFLIK